MYKMMQITKKNKINFILHINVYFGTNNVSYVSTLKNSLVVLVNFFVLNSFKNFGATYVPRIICNSADKSE